MIPHLELLNLEMERILHVETFLLVHIYWYDSKELAKMIDRL